MPLADPTYIGQVASVTGAIVRVRLREDMPSTLVMIGGESYRVGQIGGFFRVPLGYTNLYAVCTQIGADAAPPGSAEGTFGPALEYDLQLHLSGYRWMTIVLFGEALGGEFERGVGQYPTVGDEVHLVTNDDKYATALGDRARVFRVRPNEAAGERALWVPFWALPFIELQQLTLGGLQPNHEASIRDEVLDMKVAAAAHLAVPPPPETLTADSPVPFSIKKLWY